MVSPGSFLSAVSWWFWDTCPLAPQVALYLGLSPRATHEGGKLIPWGLWGDMQKPLRQGTTREGGIAVTP